MPRDKMRDKMAGTAAIERCGLCGRLFRGENFLNERQAREAEILTGAAMATITLGYCPDAPQEHYEQSEIDRPQFVTRDMAIDAGEPEMEGMRL